jgi:hypothetical protein
MDKKSFSQMIAEMSAPRMSTFQLAQVRELTSQIQRVKRSAEPTDSKLAKIEHFLETIALGPFTAKKNVADLMPTKMSQVLKKVAEEAVQTGELEVQAAKHEEIDLDRLAADSEDAAISPADRHLSSTTDFTDILTYLNTETCRCLKTADALADTLQSSPELDWSSVVLLLCKAFEIETWQRILIPLRMRSNANDLTGDLKDEDFSRIAKFCSSAIAKPPALGTFGHFLEQPFTVLAEELLVVCLRNFTNWLLSGHNRTGLSIRAAYLPQLND